MVVLKNNGKWRMCVDYSNLNDACPKDNFLLPCINHIVDATIGNELLSFLNAYSGYNKIPMFPPDSVNVDLITPTGMYYYNLMPFGHKNTGATY